MKMFLLAVLLSSQFVMAAEILVKVPKIVCSSCAEQITTALKTVPDMGVIHVDVKAKTVHIKTEKSLTDEQIRTAIEGQTRYKVESITRS